MLITQKGAYYIVLQHLVPRLESPFDGWNGFGNSGLIWRFGCRVEARRLYQSIQLGLVNSVKRPFRLLCIVVTGILAALSLLRVLIQ